MGKTVSIGVISAGAWGTALAILAKRAGSSVTLWSRNSAVIETIQQKRVNEVYLPDVFLDPDIAVTSNLAKVCSSTILLLAVPAQYLRATCISISDLVDVDIPLVICTKGIECGSLALMSEVIHSILPRNPLAVISGPNFADEAACGLPTATTIAAKDPALGEKLIFALGGKLFRPYYTDDVIGTQVGGALKNVIAIACGITVGKGLGQNARAALLTRGLAEMIRLCVAKGGRQETLMGLSGLGDLTLTCSSPKSRNMSLGLAIGQGKPIENILPSNEKGLTEGVATSEAVTDLAQKLNVTLPICEAVRSIVTGKADVDTAIKSLLERPFAQEVLATDLF